MLTAIHFTGWTGRSLVVASRGPFSEKVYVRVASQAVAGLDTSCVPRSLFQAADGLGVKHVPRSDFSFKKSLLRVRNDCAAQLKNVNAT
jgi:hypothetical protein